MGRLSTRALPRLGGMPPLKGRAPWRSEATLAALPARELGAKGRHPAEDRQEARLAPETARMLIKQKGS